MKCLNQSRQIAAAHVNPLGRQLPEPERRQLTVMFCDLVGYTALSRRLDPEELRELIRAYQATCAAVIARYEGCVARYLGDGIMIHFSYPRAHEDDAERAVLAGLGIVEAMAELNTELHRDDNIELAVRIGIATGVVIVGDLIGEGAAEEQAVVGETPNLAARLQGIAAPNTVVIDTTSQHMLAGLFNYKGLGGQVLKGFGEPVRAWQVIGQSKVESRFEAMRAAGLTPPVGHKQEVEYLLRRWKQAKGGKGQVVLLRGEAGIGKSRFIRTLCERIAADSFRQVRCQCSPHDTHRSLHAFLWELERAAGFKPEDTAEQKLDKRLEKLGAAQSQLLIIEDVQWIDPASREILDWLIERVQNNRTLVLVTSRPEFRPHWTDQAHVSLLALNRLSRAQSVAMVKRLTEGKYLPEKVIEEIVNKTDGVPMFIEELTKVVLAPGLLHSEKDRYPLSDPLTPRPIPSTLHNFLMACLHQLPALAKQVAQIGAVIGREFSYELLAEVSASMNIDPNDALEQMLRLELIIPQGTVTKPNYAFKHALVQEVVYSSLLKHKRQQLHACIAQVIEKFCERSDTQHELLAYHRRNAISNRKTNSNKPVSPVSEDRQARKIFSVLQMVERTTLLQESEANLDTTARPDASPTSWRTLLHWVRCWSQKVMWSKKRSQPSLWRKPWAQRKGRLAG